MRANRSAVSLGDVAIVTPDLDRARRFYEDVLGMRTVIVEHPRGAAVRRSANLVDRNGRASIRLLEVPGFTPGVADDLIGRRGRLDQIAFAVDSDAELASVAARLVDAGASGGSVAEVGPSRVVEFVDPDGGHHSVRTWVRGWEPPLSTEVADADALHALTDAADRPRSQTVRTENS